MLSDALNHQPSNEDLLIVKIEGISIDVLNLIEAQLDPYDVISLVFLLYDVPEIALQRLIVHQRVSKDSTNLNLLHHWAHSQSRPTWKHELLEALVICQLYSTIRQLGFHVPTVKRHFMPDNLQVYKHVNPFRKVLYKIAENMNAETFMRLKATLPTYNIYDIVDHESCELVFLDLMSRNFINVSINSEKPATYSVKKLVRIIENLPKIRCFASELQQVEDKMNQVHKTTKTNLNNNINIPMSSTPAPEKLKIDDSDDDIQDALDMLNQLNMQDIESMNFKTDSRRLCDVYPIKNPNNVGVCYIINQENFILSEESDKNNVTTVLKRRVGSSVDKKNLERVMSHFKFEVIVHENLPRKKMMESFKDIVRYRVQHDHSIFMLCILSHGFKGHVYAADCLEVNVDEIRNFLDSEEAKHLWGMPKMLIIQACQVNEEKPQLPLVADSALTRSHLKKSDVLVFWATSPDYKAFRHEVHGSIFIISLTRMIYKYGATESITDIFTEVNRWVTEICIKNNYEQQPTVELTLNKKLYFRIPK